MKGFWVNLLVYLFLIGPLSFTSTELFSAIWKLISTNLYIKFILGFLYYSFKILWFVFYSMYYVVTIPSRILYFIIELLGLWNEDLDQDFFTWFL